MRILVQVHACYLPLSRQLPVLNTARICACCRWQTPKNTRSRKRALGSWVRSCPSKNPGTLKCSYLHTNHTGFIPGVLNRSSKKWIIPNRVGPGFCYTTTDVHNGTTLHNNGSPDLIFILEGGVHGYMHLCTLGDVCNHATFKPIQAPIAFFGTRKFSHRTASCDLVSCLRTYRKGSR